jgi:pimeloyl-ACP methyl ester carboxylesterase
MPKLSVALLAAVLGFALAGSTAQAAPPPGKSTVVLVHAYLRSFLATVPGPIVLVGHSDGGFVLTSAAAGNSNVGALVYVAAFAPDLG